MGKFKASKAIVEQSWAILMKDKEIMLFPIVSVVVSTVAVIVMIAVYYFMILGGSMPSAQHAGDNQNVLSYVVLFIYYFVMFFIVNFFQAGIYIIVHARFNGRDMNFNDGIRGAMQNINKIFVWSLISATVGVILQFIANQSKLIGKVVAWLFGAAWNILTYFSLPSLIIGQTTVENSFKDSASIIRKTWGETIIVNIGVGLFFGLLMLVGFLFGIIAIILVPDPFMIFTIILLLIIYCVVLMIISASLGAIFKLALYEYARTGITPRGFSSELIQHAIKAK